MQSEQILIVLNYLSQTQVDQVCMIQNVSKLKQVVSWGYGNMVEFKFYSAESKLTPIRCWISTETQAEDVHALPMIKTFVLKTTQVVI